MNWICKLYLCLYFLSFASFRASLALVSVARRRAIQFVCGTGIFIHPRESIGAAPVNPAEAVRRSAANIPGYGQTDVFYPESFAGSWKAVREVLPSGLKLEYPVRFLPSIEDRSVVADRGWNQANLERAIRQRTPQGSPQVPLPLYQWTETNPNDLRIKFANGNVKDIKVTKRATEKTDNTVFSSEFQRVTTEDSRGIPEITARRVMTKWKVLDGDIIEGIEVVYDVGGGDPMLGAATDARQNQILSKSRITLQRQ